MNEKLRIASQSLKGNCGRILRYCLDGSTKDRSFVGQERSTKLTKYLHTPRHKPIIEGGKTQNLSPIFSWSCPSYSVFIANLFWSLWHGLSTTHRTWVIKWSRVPSQICPKPKCMRNGWLMLEGPIKNFANQQHNKSSTIRTFQITKPESPELCEGKLKEASVRWPLKSTKMVRYTVSYVPLYIRDKNIFY